MPRLSKNLDDILLVCGCICILIGVAQFSPAAAWICAGLMFIAFAYLIAKKNASNLPGL